MVPPERIRAVVARVGGIARIGAIRSRGTPDAVYLDLRVGLDPALTVAEADGIVREVVGTIHGEIEAVADVVVHIESVPGALRAGPED